MSDKANLLYRYRPFKITECKDVVQELENNEIYLAALDENNDPMDGIQEVYWEGDEPLWRNLIRHYCLCLVDSFHIIEILGQTEEFTLKNIRAWMTFDQLPTPAYQNLVSDFFDLVEKDDRIQGLVDLLIAKEKLYQEGLNRVFTLCHFRVLGYLKQVIKNHLDIDLELSEIHQEFSEADVFKAFHEASDDALKIIFREFSHATQQIILLYEARFLSEPKGLRLRARNLGKLFAEFPVMYFKALARDTHYDYYVACFSRNNDNPLMWAHYSEGHKGICLVFEIPGEEDAKCFRLKNDKQLSGAWISYGDNPPTYNFYKALGHLTFNQISSNWINFNGKKSTLVSHYSNADNFRQKYWDIHHKKLSHKFSIWENEAEFRVEKITFEGPLNKERRVLQYDIRQLKGVIFGLRTPMSEKARILEVIDRKLSTSQKKEFRFYQAEYNPSDQKMAISEMSLVKFKIDGDSQG